MRTAISLTGNNTVSIVRSNEPKRALMKPRCAIIDFVVRFTRCHNKKFIKVMTVKRGCIGTPPMTRNAIPLEPFVIMIIHHNYRIIFIINRIIVQIAHILKHLYSTVILTLFAVLCQINIKILKKSPIFLK